MADRPCPGVGVDVAAVEGVVFSAAGQSVGPLVDLARLTDPDVAGEVGERAVVRGDDDVPVVGPHGDAAAVRAHARIHDGDEDRAGGPVARRLVKPIKGREDVEGRDPRRPSAA